MVRNKELDNEASSRFTATQSRLPGRSIYLQTMLLADDGGERVVVCDSYRPPLASDRKRIENGILCRGKTVWR